MPSRHWCTLNSHPITSLLVRLVEGEERWEAPDHLQGVLPQNWGGTEQNRTVTCMVLKAKATDKRKNLALAAMNFVYLHPVLLSISGISNNNRKIAETKYKQ
ncbi:uncharacterized protein TNCV_1240691 [Trichonephila clavipes]|uniref:Uncharacterized protein n=1 Tax=Trichonephila clavipes TaxID=2585209 RepID=A0A8X6WDU5_TRICX|nr:uncharacterized protein TNCV_1240691 [Trichonephila clavipes]